MFAIVISSIHRIYSLSSVYLLEKVLYYYPLFAQSCQLIYWHYGPASLLVTSISVDGLDFLILARLLSYKNTSHSVKMYKCFLSPNF